MSTVNRLVSLECFQASSIKNPAVLAVLGPRRAGKSSMVRHLVHSAVSTNTNTRYRIIVLTSMMEDDGREYKHFFQNNDTTKNCEQIYAPMTLEEVSKAVRICQTPNANVHTFLIVHKSTQDWKNAIWTQMCEQKDTLKLTVVFDQCYWDWTPEFRSYFDYVIFTRMSHRDLQLRVWKHFCGATVQKYSDFEQIFKECTKNYDMLVLKNTSDSKPRLMYSDATDRAYTLTKFELWYSGEYNHLFRNDLEFQTLILQDCANNPVEKTRLKHKFANLNSRPLNIWHEIQLPVITDMMFGRSKITVPNVFDEFCQNPSLHFSFSRDAKSSSTSIPSSTVKLLNLTSDVTKVAKTEDIDYIIYCEQLINVQFINTTNTTNRQYIIPVSKTGQIEFIWNTKSFPRISEIKAILVYSEVTPVNY